MRQDYLEDDEEDLLFQNGDLVVGDSDEKHIADVLMTNKGDYRQYPDLGLGPLRFKNKVLTKSLLIRDMKEELKKDGYKNLNITFDGDSYEEFTIKHNG